MGLNLLKGMGHQTNIFSKAYKIKSVSVLSAHALQVFKFLACLVQGENMYQVSACFFVFTFSFKKFAPKAGS
jgi:hypothetical protein